MLEKIVPKTTEFMLSHASMGADLRIGGCELKNVGGDIYRVRAQIKNVGSFGTKVMKGIDSYQSCYPVHIYLETDENTEILSRPGIYEVPKLDALESVYAEWFIKKPDSSAVTVCAEHPKASSARAEIK